MQQRPIKKVKATNLPRMGAALVEAAGLGKWKPEATREEYSHLMKKAVHARPR